MLYFEGLLCHNDVNLKNKIRIKKRKLFNNLIDSLRRVVTAALAADCPN